MTETDEHLLAIAKLRERLRGDLDHGDRTHDHAGLIEEATHRSSMDFLANALDDNIEETALGAEVMDHFKTKAATEAVFTGNGAVATHLTGVTETDMDGSSLRLNARLNELMDNNGAPCFAIGAGNPNTGKTNTMALLVEIRQYQFDEYLVLSNIRSWTRTDHVVTNAHDLAVKLLEHRDVPKAIFLDEASTHMDARTYSREVSQQWTPLAKRFAKIGVDFVGTVIHTGKDAHPEVKRLATLPFFKPEKSAVEIYDRWPADEDHPDDVVLSVDDLEPTGTEYDPNDAAPWSWNLKPELFAQDLDWSELLDELQRRGPE